MELALDMSKPIFAEIGNSVGFASRVRADLTLDPEPLADPFEIAIDRLTGAVTCFRASPSLEYPIFASDTA